MLEFKEAKKIIKKSNKIYIVGHVNPDGDALGSAFSLCLALRKIGKDAKVIVTKHSQSFDFFPNMFEVKANVEESEYDILIGVDSSDPSRLDISEEDKNKAKNIIMIDHHKKSNPYGNINIIEEGCPATCQLMFDFITYLKIKIDASIAFYLYAGILTDTGSFNYAVTTPKTLNIVSKLVATGIDFPYICKKLNDTIKESKLKLIATAINNMEVYNDGAIRYTHVDYETISKLGVDEEDAEGMTNYLRMVDGTEVAIYVRGKSNGTNKVSLRSGNKVDVSTIAIHFGGGGHRRAAGFTMTKDLATSKQELLTMINELLKEGV